MDVDLMFRVLKGHQACCCFGKLMVELVEAKQFETAAGSK
jgi:hypothetical protein